MAYFSKYDLTKKYVKIWPYFMTLWLYDFWVPLIIREMKLRLPKGVDWGQIFMVSEKLIQAPWQRNGSTQSIETLVAHCHFQVAGWPQPILFQNKPKMTQISGYEEKKILVKWLPKFQRETQNIHTRHNMFEPKKSEKLRLYLPIFGTSANRRRMDWWRGSIWLLYCSYKFSKKLEVITIIVKKLLYLRRDWPLKNVMKREWIKSLLSVILKSLRRIFEIQVFLTMPNMKECRIKTTLNSNSNLNMPKLEFNTWIF